MGSTDNSAQAALASLQNALSGKLPSVQLGWNNWTIALTILAILLTWRYVITPPHVPFINTSEIRNLPGPPRPWFSWLLGNMIELAEHRDTLLHPDWVKKSWTGRYESLFRQERIYTCDPATIQFIFARPDDFERPTDLRTILGNIMGYDGLAVIEGEKHRRQRRVLNPAFSLGAIRDLLPAMYDKATDLQLLLERLVDDDALEAYASRVPPKPEDRVAGARKVDMLKLAGNLTTDVIGMAGFDHDFRSLVPEEDDPKLLANRFTRMVDAANAEAFLTEAQNTLPILDKIVRLAGRS